MSENDIKYLVGNGNVNFIPMKVYSEIVCDFLEELSKCIMRKPAAKQYPDVITFAFWCRKSNILRLKEEYNSKYVRVGRGNVFHIAPSNIPINFAFSLVFGLLAGNSNVVRISDKEFKQVDIVCDCINECLDKAEYNKLKGYISIVKYRHNKDITDELSAQCASRVIWGGDNTVEEIRSSSIPCRANEITFADRYSFAIIDENKVEQDSKEEVRKLAEGFYNDTYLMDQNACSSPHLIIWKASEMKKGREIFWNQLMESAKKYDLQAKKVVDKYTLAAELSASGELKFELKTYSNYLYVGKLRELPEKLDIVRGKYGFFYETDLKPMEELCRHIGTKVQTCATYGIDNNELMNELIGCGCQGIDRIVPIGKAMDISVYWDGYDIIGTLSRIIAVE